MTASIVRNSTPERGIIISVGHRHTGWMPPLGKPCKDVSSLVWIFLILMLLCPMLQAQDKIKYSYDAAGNRISRTIVLAPRSAPVDETKPVVHTEVFSDMQLKIYPNPTTGRLKVEISNLPEGHTAQIWLYAMSGKLITTYKDVSYAVNIDISGQPAGNYVMKIVAGNFQTEWKIIKK